MAVNGVGNNVSIDWKIMLDNIAGGQKASGSEGAQGTPNLVMSESDKATLLTMLTTPDINTPEGTVEDPAAKLESLINKLEGENTFNFTDEQLQTFTNTLKTLLTKVNSLISTLNANAAEGSSASGKTNTAQALLDIYQVMALLFECAQEMKNAQREQRQAESQAVITSIQNQADKQRSAALTGLIAGSIICAVQVVATCVSAYKTISNTKAEATLSNEFNVNQSATELGTAESELKTAQNDLKAFNQEHPAPAEGEDAHLQQRQQLQTRVDEAKQSLIEKRATFESSKQRMRHSDGYDALQRSQAWTKATFDLSQAFGNFGQTLVRGLVDLQQAEATAMTADQKKAEEALEQTKDLMASFQDVIDQVAQLAQAVLAAENESMRDAIQA